MLRAFYKKISNKRRKQADDGKSACLVYLICVSISSSAPETILISRRCGRQIIGTAPPEMAPLETHTLSGQSADITAILPSFTRIVLDP